MRIGVNPILWTNDDLPELGAETPLDQCLAEAREVGYEGIELGIKFPREANALRPVLEEHGLALVTGWYGTHMVERSVKDELAALRPHLGLLAKLGCQVLVVSEVTGAIHATRGIALSRRPVLDRTTWRKLTDRLARLAEHVARRGLRLAYHPHMGTVVQTEDEIDRLLNDTAETVGLVLDTGHLAFAGADALALVRRHGRRIVHVHLKDVRFDPVQKARAANASFLDAVLDGVFAVPGEGNLDFAPLVDWLHSGGYKGWLVVEADQNPATEEPRASAQKGFEHVTHLVGAIEST